ncbi:MAG: hypothetical protein HYV63_24085 [Candidatus Schekmanbacteria bacterium]|nr:hypothetical protein [Candidatus Schekmanbacteria bacterium]
MYPLGNGDALAIWVIETYGTPWNLRQVLWTIWPIHENVLTWHETVIASKLGDAGQAVRCIEWVQECVGKHKALFRLLPGVLQEPVAAAISCHLVCTTALAEGKVEEARKLIADAASRALRFTAVSSVNKLPAATSERQVGFFGACRLPISGGAIDMIDQYGCRPLGRRHVWAGFGPTR